MIQVDVFWSFGIGAAFATAAHRQIAADPGPWTASPYFRYTLLFQSLVFNPSGAYLLWANPGWESMYMLSGRMPAIIPCLFAFANVALGILGYWTAYRCIKRGKKGLAHAAWAFGWGVSVLILLIGFRRFTYAGTFEDWHGPIDAWAAFRSEPVRPLPLGDFLHSHIFRALLVMGIPFLPAFILPVVRWGRAGRLVPPSRATS
jgi:hypothetical protein